MMLLVAPRSKVLLSTIPVSRSFSSSISRLRPSTSSFSHLKVNSNRLHDSLHHTCQWGALPDLPVSDPQKESISGMRRLALDDNDKKVRDWFVKETQDLGCKVEVDQMGNIFATLPGKQEGLPVALGSHLDTQPMGGRFDGILGIHSAIEVFRVIKENYKPNYPLTIVNWTNEEGARFPASVLSSGVWAGKIGLEEAWRMKEIESLSSSSSGELRTVKEELSTIGYLGTIPCSWKANPLKAHFELHIEQGPVLERSEKKIGVVKGGQAYNWFELTLRGRESHTGTTPLESRSDPLLAAAEIMGESNQQFTTLYCFVTVRSRFRSCRDSMIPPSDLSFPTSLSSPIKVQSRRIGHKHSGRISTGVLSLTPGSINTIPGEVNMTLDLRHSSDEVLSKMTQELKSQVQEICSSTELNFKPIESEWRTITQTSAVKFDKSCVDCVRESANEILGEDGWEEMVSGAGHDR